MKCPEWLAKIADRMPDDMDWLPFLAIWLLIVVGGQLALASCVSRQPIPLAQTVPAQAASSTAAQSAEIAPVVLTATGAGIAAIGVGVALKDPHLVAAGVATSVGALALQRFLVWIPWLIAAAAVYMAIRYAIKHKLLANVWAKDRAKLEEVRTIATNAVATVTPHAATLAGIADDLTAHLK